MSPAGGGREHLVTRRSRGWPTPWSTSTTSSICSTAWSGTAWISSPRTPPGSCWAMRRGTLRVVAASNDDAS